MINNFIEKIIKNDNVYIIEYKDEVAIAQSLLFKTDVNEPVNVVCFWSDKEQAVECCKEIWKNYKPTALCLATFIEDYLVNIYNESFIVGIDFNEKMEGIEADPLDVLSELIKKMKKQKIDLEFEYFKNLTDLENQLHKFALTKIKQKLSNFIINATLAKIIFYEKNLHICFYACRIFIASTK